MNNSDIPASDPIGSKSIEPQPIGRKVDHVLFERNVRAFTAHIHPAITKKILEHKPLSKLVVNEDGDWDVDFRGQLLYGAGGKIKAEAMAERYRGQVGQRFKMAPLASGNLDRPAGEFIFHLLKKATEKGLEFAQYPTSEEGYHLISFGLGLGYHLPNLIKMTQCESICIVEPNLDFLYHSLGVMDWEPLLSKNASWPSVYIVLDETGMADRVREHCRACNPTSVDWAIVVSAYSNEVMSRAMRELVRDAALIMMGLGFMVDEAEMTRASFLNLCRGEYRIYTRQTARLKTPAFVIGSGPSIDQDIEIIKEYKDRAVIFACGTSARILLANGIEPDFMLLLENGEVPVDAMEKVAAAYDVGDAVMIASNTVSPRVKSICKETVYFFRTSLSPYPVFCPGLGHYISDPGPTVANTGLGAALGLGFKELYLFGIDLGSRNPKAHHSKHSAYVRREGEGDDQEVLPFDAVFDHPAVGNFGGVVFTESIMEWTRDALARVIGDNSQRAIVYNCSDGVRIDNTMAKASEAIELETTAQDKKKDLASIMAEMPRVSCDDAIKRWESADGLGQIKDLCRRLKEETEVFPESTPEFFRRILPLLLTDHKRLPSFGEYFLRGTLFMSVSAIDYYVRRVTDPEKRKIFEGLVLQEFHRFIDNLERWAEWFFEHMEEYSSSIELERDFCGLPYE